MKVEYRTKVTKSTHEKYGPREDKTYELARPPALCCQGMSRAWDHYGGGPIGFGDELDYAIKTPVVSIFEVECGSCGDDNEVTDHQISFCPFCGEKIECVEVERRVVRKVEKKVEQVVTEEVEETEAPQA